MKQKNLVLTAAVAVAVMFFASCKIEEAKPALEVEFGEAEIQVILQGNLNTTNDTTKNGSFSTTYEAIEGVTVIATTSTRNFYSTTSGNYPDEVITGVTDANGIATLKVRVGERANINYNVRISDKAVTQRTSTNVNDLPEDKVASYGGSINFTVNKGATEIQKIVMNLN